MYLNRSLTLNANSQMLAQKLKTRIKILQKPAVTTWDAGGKHLTWSIRQREYLSGCVAVARFKNAYNHSNNPIYSTTVSASAIEHYVTQHLMKCSTSRMGKNIYEPITPHTPEHSRGLYAVEG